MGIELSSEVRKQALSSIRRYCVENLELEANDIHAIGLLDYFLKELAPIAYNAGVADAQAYLRDRLTDLEGSCYEPPFAYWPKSGTVRRK